MFYDSSNGIEEYITLVTGFINKCIADIIPTVPVRTFPNLKPWITGNSHTELNARASAFKEQDTNPDAYKKSMPSDGGSNRQSINTGLRLNPTTPALMLVGYCTVFTLLNWFSIRCTHTYAILYCLNLSNWFRIRFTRTFAILYCLHRIQLV